MDTIRIQFSSTSHHWQIHKVWIQYKNNRWTLDFVPPKNHILSSFVLLHLKYAGSLHSFSVIMIDDGKKCDFPRVHTSTWTSVPLCCINLSHGTEPTFYKAPLPSMHCSALRDAKCLTLPERGGPLPCLWSQWRQMTGHTYITHMHERASMPLERLLSIHVMLAFLTSPRACNGWRSESRL